MASTFYCVVEGHVRVVVKCSFECATKLLESSSWSLCGFVKRYGGLWVESGSVFSSTGFR